MLATQAAIALQNASLVAGLQEAQDSVQASEQRFRLLFEHAPLGIFEIDISDVVPRIRAANRRAGSDLRLVIRRVRQPDAAQLIPDESRRPDPARVWSRVWGPARPPSSKRPTGAGTARFFPVRIIATPASAQRGLR
ncbi:MAG: hypothetical protein IPO81_28090 [Kouleothrix sp.]|nr:hypothetical protein [Kouleothrix sp.]